MRSQPWFRVFASMLALWFPLIAGEPGLLHPCPMHGAGAAVIASLSGHAVAPASGHASHTAVRHDAHTTNSHGGTPSHDHHSCTCINGCSVSVSAATAPSAPTIVVVVLAAATAVNTSDVPTLAHAAPEFARPYTTGPPRA